MNVGPANDVQKLGPKIRILPPLSSIGGQSIGRFVHHVVVIIGCNCFRDFENFSEFWKKRAYTNSSSFVVLDLGFRNIENSFFKINMGPLERKHLSGTA